MAANFKAVLTVKGVVKDQVFLPSKRSAELWAFGDPKAGTKSIFLTVLPATDRQHAKVTVYEIVETKVLVCMPGTDHLPPVPVKRDCKFLSGCISHDCLQLDQKNEPRVCERGQVA